MDLKLKGKRAFVSGSTQGIGFAIAKQLLREGAAVTINGRSSERVNEAVNRLKQEVKDAIVNGIAADFSKKEDIDNLLSQLTETDILINNTGIFEPKAFTDIPDEDWFRFFEVNVMSGVRLSRQLLPGMLQRNWGRIIFISSESAINIPEEMIHYGMTKTAQLSISRGLAELTKGTAVTVNAVLPGPTASEGLTTFVGDLAKAQNITIQQAEKEFFKTTRPTSLLQRFEDVNEIASLVTYIASPLSSGTNGASLRADGGLLKSIY
ncbi:MAG TPA: SDR family NAD(P)-dependent oxidoreductase [Chitinophaga sp.]|uniref:SDR family NAD(P)-dependent oxidoreductase n=1 Tax=Chitinophaga sp. TaxID=1869181 RepID=UPI002C3A9A75|nr:SDR family NAD(P)-dependent oxidoreductase [Chitinophaga sp.]HVI47806.1 SDR family NAD(P)-dependent oxidoreductase [Chitinophaga sp.]